MASEAPGMTPLAAEASALLAALVDGAPACL